MDENSRHLVEDCFLQVPASAKISAKKSEDRNEPSQTLRVEMQTLRLRGDSQNLILETLRHIHGPDFELTKSSEYKDKGYDLGNRYWIGRSLVVQGGCDYSKKTDPTTSEDKFRMYALKKLEMYGFHKTHCAEALDYTNGQIDTALEVLYDKYFEINSHTNSNCESMPEELLETRSDEKAVLESIFDSTFKEKEHNTFWEFNLKLDYLTKLFIGDKEKIVSSRKEPISFNSKNSNFKTKKSELCRNFSRGNCKYGDKCRFSHEKIESVSRISKETTNNNFDFFLEIKFRKNTNYPYESPIILMKSTAPANVIPQLTCLHICRRLLIEADLLSQDGTPSIYSVVDLLLNEEKICEYLKSNDKKFIDASKLLFPVIKDDGFKKNLPSHYEKASNRSDKNNKNFETILKEDQLLAQKFIEKQNNGQYKKMIEDRKKLPAWNKMNDILNTIEKAQVTVISGETGCGKSTQIPQFLLDEWLLNKAKNSNKSHLEIVCTQPRRISAMGVADRVADERVERTGTTVGYQIRLESKVSSKTRLLFCTIGILLRRLESDPNLTTVTHVIVDEVHERSEESDFLLLILRDLLKSRKDLKVILMSATLNVNLFSDYFGDVPTLEIPGRTFPVEQVFLEEILVKTKYILEENSKYARKIKKASDLHDPYEIEMTTADVVTAKTCPKTNIRDENLRLGEIMGRYPNCTELASKSLYIMDSEKVNLELIEHILTYIVEGNHNWPKEGAVVVFLPGISEITSLYDMLSDNKIFSPKTGNYMLVPLHSTLSSEEQTAVFCRPKQGVRKIVLSTNIAETSVTIDDCVFVIDSGKMKEKRFDANRNMESLDMIWVSKANAKQRKGRAGRVMPGICIHLFTSHRFEHHLLNQPVPEIHRVPLEQLILRTRVLPLFEDVSVHKVLGDTLEPPSEENIDSALARLQDVGALDRNLRLTPLGAHLAALPVDVRIGKLMLFGAIFCCLDSALTIAACLSHKNPFVSPFGKREQADSKKKEFFIGNSDQLTTLKAYKKWQEALSHGKYAGQVFANENYLSSKALSMLGDIKHQLLELLSSIGFVPALKSGRRSKGGDKVLEYTGQELNCNGENQKLLAAILCAALYPNVVKVLSPEQSFKKSLGGAIHRTPKAEDLRFKTKTGNVFIHPTSVNYNVCHFTTPYLVYHEKVKTSRIFIRDCSMVPLLPFILFSGCQLAIELHRGTYVVSLEDGWTMFQVETIEVAEMLKTIRAELINLLEEKIKDPCLNLLHHENGSKIINTIVQIITKE